MLLIGVDAHNKEIQRRIGRRFECLVYQPQGQKCTYIHHVCGRKFDMMKSRFLNRVLCPHCWTQARLQGAAKRAHYGTLHRFNELYGDDYTLNDAHISVKDKVLVTHRECGRTYETTLELMLHLHKQHGRCPQCFPHHRGAGYKVTVCGGREWLTQGYEHRSLPGLVAKYGAANIIPASDPDHLRVPYTFEGRPHHYTPDFSIPAEHVAVEVKSLATLGLISDEHEFFGHATFERNQVKARALRDAGYFPTLHLYDGGDTLDVPHRWYDMPKVDLADLLDVSLS